MRRLSNVTASVAHLRLQAGLGLIEVLVALLILAIGVLGIASTQIVSLKVNTQSQARSQAVLLAEDLFDRIRANPGNIAGYALADAVANGGDDGDCDTSFSPNSGNLTQDDIDSWENSLACLLPQAEREVVINGNVVTITIDWDQEDDEFAMDPVVIRAEV